MISGSDKPMIFNNIAAIMAGYKLNQEDKCNHSNTNKKSFYD